MGEATQWLRRLVNMTRMSLDSIVYVYSGIYEWQFHHEIPDHEMHSRRETALWIFSRLMANETSWQDLQL